MTVVTSTRPAGVGPCAVGALLSCSSVSVFRWREQGKTCTHMWDVMRREGPGSVLFSTDGIQGRGGREGGGALRKGVCVCVVWGRGRRGGLPQCLLPLSVNKWTPPPSQQRLGRRPRSQDTPLCLHIHAFYQSVHLRLQTLSVSISFLRPLSTFVSSLSVVVTRHTTLIPIGSHLFLVQGQWPDSVDLPDCVNVFLSCVCSALPKKTEMA